jgi:predicted amidohydrolase
VKIAAVQHDIVWNDRQANFDRLAPRIRDAAVCGADLVVLSETFSTGFVVDAADIGEPEGGPSSQFLADQAAEHGVWVGGSCPEIADAGDDDRRPYNTFVFAGPDGTTHRYRKIHSFTYGGEPKHFRAGSELTSLTIAGVRVTPFVCYDLRFADEFWQRATATDVYVVTANWPSPRRLHWQVLLQARAVENLAYVVGCNRVGLGGGLDYAGDSRVVDPLGELLATAAGDETTLLATIDPERVAATRARFGFLDDRREFP